MSSTIPNIEPTSCRAGDTLKWTKSLSDYLPSDGWTLKYNLVGSGGQKNVTAATSGDEFLVTFAAADTTSFTAGVYTLTGWVEKAGERYTIYEASIEVRANVAAASVASDTRSHYEKTLDLIKSAIESYAVRPVNQITIAGRTLLRPTLDELSRLRAKYEKLVRRQNAKSNPKRIVARFSGS